ncbi:MAG TPA: DUF1036 domain-containing protein [Steroidobacteraceae bacterium]
MVALFTSHLARAGFTLCNRTSEDKLIVATASTWYAQDQTTGERVIDAESMGWTTIAKGSCALIHPYPIRFRDFYFVAYSAAKPTLRWTGQYNYCIDPKGTFDYYGRSKAQTPCPAGVPVGMIFVDTMGADDFRFPIFDQRPELSIPSRQR